MLIKLGIIGVILVVAGLIFSSEINTLFPNTSATVMDSIKYDVGNISSKTTKSVENRIDNSLDSIVDKTNDEINNVKESSKEIVTNKLNNINPIQTIGKIFKSDDVSDDSENIQTDEKSTLNKQPIQNIKSPTETNSQSLLHETLSLSTTQQPNGDILLNYLDSTEKTESVTVIIRTSEKEIFSGTLYTSSFETIVNNVPDTPYYVDMIVEHQDYGKVTSSVFNSGEYSNSIINGIFSQSN